MRLLIKQRVFSWTDSYDVYDENENAKYFVKAEFFSLGHQLHIYDRNDRELGVIRQRLFTLLPAFEIEIGGQVKGEIRKQFSFFKPRYEIDYNGWRVEGDFLGWDYDVYNGCSSIIHISKELFHWGDTYTINFSDPQDELEGLMLVIAIEVGLAYIVGCIIHYIALRVLGWLYGVTHIGWLADYYHRNTAAVVIAVAGVLWIWFG